LARRLGEGGSWLTARRARLLSETLARQPAECAELLRRNAFWPILTACVETKKALSSDSDDVVAALDTLCLVLQDKPSSKDPRFVLCCVLCVVFCFVFVLFVA
jgi:hypothetical protein